MQDLKNCAEFSGRLIISLCRKLRHFAQSNRRKEEEGHPGQTADVTSHAGRKDPRESGDSKHHNRSDTRAMILHAGTPCPGQHQQR
jgi:hypothetical protein